MTTVMPGQLSPCAIQLSLRDANFFIRSLSIGGDIILSTVVPLEFSGLFLNFKSLPLWTKAG